MDLYLYNQFREALYTNNWVAHGIGKLAYTISKDDTQETRFHIWDPDIILIGPDEGAIHNHNHSFCSTILYGALEETRYTVYPSTWNLFQKRQTALDDYILWEHRTPNGTVSRDSVTIAEDDTSTYYPGCTYNLPSTRFHFSRPLGLTITLVQRYFQPHSSYAVAKRGFLVQDGLLNCICEGGIEATLEKARAIINGSKTNSFPGF